MHFQSSLISPLKNNLVAHADCSLVQRIVAGWKENDEEQAKGRPRRGYMGHLISLASTAAAIPKDYFSCLVCIASNFFFF
jgi:hypothetical protein